MSSEDGQGDRWSVQGWEGHCRNWRCFPTGQCGPDSETLLVPRQCRSEESKDDEDREKQSDSGGPRGTGWEFSAHGLSGARSRSRRAFNAFSPSGPTKPPVYLSATIPSAPMKTVVGIPGMAYASITFSSGAQTTG